MNIKKKGAPADVSVPSRSGEAARFDEQSGNPLHNEDTS